MSDNQENIPVEEKPPLEIPEAELTDILPIDPAELQKFKEIIFGLVPEAARITKQALNPRSKLKPKRVELAWRILEQYSKLMSPEIERHEIRVVDEATLAQIKQAQDVMSEYNKYLSEQNLRKERFTFGQN